METGSFTNFKKAKHKSDSKIIYYHHIMLIMDIPKIGNKSQVLLKSKSFLKNTNILENSSYIFYIEAALRCGGAWRRYTDKTGRNRQMIIQKNQSYMTEEQSTLFHQGTDVKSYKMLGAHFVKQDDGREVVFRVWAPNAKWVSVVGEFNSWNIYKHPMKRVNQSGIWEIFVPDIEEKQLYKYAIGTSKGEVLYKADPYAYYSELRPGTASVLYDIENYSWQDEGWEKYKSDNPPNQYPMVIYEVHLGSWDRKEDGSFYSYREIASKLVDYVITMGYTHIEFMPIMEHPFDGSWGYQVTGYYSVTSRYGTPEDFMYLVDLCHQNRIGVILDWVPGHFPKDAHGLARFDGTALYEHEDPRKGEHPQWGTLIFNYTRNEVQSFLISNVIFWLEYYHIDGFRVDAVTSMLYLDYARDEWIPNCYGGRENLEAAAFLKRLNETVFSLFPNTLMIAEDSSQWPMVTGPVQYSGLGFSFKWNMGWMNDTLKYCSMDPYFRKWNHNLLTFSLHYAFSEQFILPLSHDEVVHGKHSLLDKMPGDYSQKFAGLRVLFAYMMAHPGKKLTFMGGEFGQFIEWKFDDKLDWLLLDYEMHRKTQEYVKELNHFYLKNPSLWEDDSGWNGFEWINPDDQDQSVLSFIRKGHNPQEWVLVIANFTPVFRPEYRVGIPKAAGCIAIFNTDDIRFGGSGLAIEEVYIAEEYPYNNREHSVILKVPPLSVAFYKPIASKLDKYTT